MEKPVYKLDVTVIARIVQIIQEGFLTGTDVSDHMRMIEVETSDKDTTKLVLTAAYKAQAERNIEAMVDFAAAQLRERQAQDADEGN
jgi:ABC-type arginine transport system ATPase subunit